MALRTRNAALLINPEVTPGTFVEPDPATEMVRVSGLQVTNDPNVLDDPTLTGGLDTGERQVGAVRHAFTATTQLRGATAAGGTPDWDTLAQIAGLLPTAQAVVPAAGATTCTGGSTTTATVNRNVDTDWSATNQAYKGRVIEVDIDGVGAGASVFTTILDYTVVAGVATITFSTTMTAPVTASSTVKLPQQRIYIPGSANIPSASARLHRDGRSWAFSGCRGNARITLNSGNRGQLDFNVNARGHSTVLNDVAVPADTTNASPRPPLWMNSTSLPANCALDKITVAAQTFTLDMGNQMVLPDNPNQAEALDETEIISRDITGTTNPLAVLVATRATFAAFKAGTPMSFAALLVHGQSAGGRIALTVPRIIATNVGEGDRQGLVSDEISFQAAGANAGCYLSLF
jgi:hypothetical protein